MLIIDRKFCCLRVIFVFDYEWDLVPVSADEKAGIFQPVLFRAWPRNVPVGAASGDRTIGWNNDVIPAVSMPQ